MSIPVETLERVKILFVFFSFVYFAVNLAKHFPCSFPPYCPHLPPLLSRAHHPTRYSPFACTLDEVVAILKTLKVEVLTTVMYFRYELLNCLEIEAKKKITFILL
jgi:hypothetical protein